MQPLERPSPISRMCCTYALSTLSTVHRLLNGRLLLLSQSTVAILRLFFYVFAHAFLFNPHFNLEPDCIVRKPLLHRILRYIPCREILSTFHTRVDRRSVPRSVCHFSIQINGAGIPKNAANHARNSPFPLRHVDFHLTHECLSPPHSPRQTASTSNQPFCHNSHVRTDRWDKRFLRSISALLSYSDKSDALISKTAYHGRPT